MTTEAPAKVIGAAGRLGTLGPGAAADVTLLRRESGSFELTDTRGESLKHGERLVPVRVVRNGVLRAASLQQARHPRGAASPGPEALP